MITNRRKYLQEQGGVQRKEGGTKRRWGFIGKNKCVIKNAQHMDTVSDDKRWA